MKPKTREESLVEAVADTMDHVLTARKPAHPGLYMEVLGYLARHPEHLQPALASLGINSLDDALLYRHRKETK